MNENIKILDYIEKGGPIMYILLFLSILGLTIIISKIISFIKLKNDLNDISRKIADEIKSEYLNEEIEKNVSEYLIKPEKGLETLKTISTTAPLLGLLGTVLGILDSFEKISSKGMETTYFASGISLALITTIGGLIVAIPNTIGYNYLIKFLEELEIKLTKKILEIKTNEKKKIN